MKGILYGHCHIEKSPGKIPCYPLKRLFIPVIRTKGIGGTINSIGQFLIESQDDVIKLFLYVTHVIVLLPILPYINNYLANLSLSLSQIITVIYSVL